MDLSLWWIHALLAPVYLVLGTLRHEGMHAITAWRYGAEIIAFKVIPHRFNGRFYFGRVQWQAVFTDHQKRMVLGMPYLFDVVCITACVVTLVRVEMTDFHVFAVTVINLGISPLVDLLYNVGKWLFRGTGDLAEIRSSK